MEYHKARIYHKGKLIADGVDIYLRHFPPSSDSLGKWYGTYNAEALFDLDKGFLELDDGRSGEIVFKSTNTFQGRGPLKRAD
jgi:hypothetical protein